MSATGRKLIFPSNDFSNVEHSVVVFDSGPVVVTKLRVADGL